MTSSQETERVYSYNHGAHMGQVAMEKYDSESRPSTRGYDSNS